MNGGLEGRKKETIKSELYYNQKKHLKYIIKRREHGEVIILLLGTMWDTLHTGSSHRPMGGFF